LRLSSRWRATSAAAATCFASSSTWMSERRMAGAWTRSSAAELVGLIDSEWPLEAVDPITRAKSPAATATETAEARSASSPRSRSPFAGTAAELASQLKEGCTRASLPLEGTTSRAPARGGFGSGARRANFRGLHNAQRPLLGAENRGDGAPSEGRDVAYRRVRGRAWRLGRVALPGRGRAHRE